MTDPLTLMAVHAHPDDACISTGGSLARYREEGVRTTLVTATCGEEGEIVDPAMDPAVSYRDSGMIDTLANDDPDCFAQADRHAVRAESRLLSASVKS